MKLSDLNINTPDLIAAARVNWTFGAHDLAVRKYLPISEKTDFINFVIFNSLDSTTGTCSPLRSEVYFALAVAKWYAGLEFELDTTETVTNIYDTLELSGFNREIGDVIGEDYHMILDMTNDTIDDYTRYSTSLAGMLNTIGQNTNEIDKQLSEVMEKIKDKEGLETLDAIKNVVGTD